MNMNFIFNFITEVMNLFASWLSVDKAQWAWCPARVDNRNDSF